MRQYRAHQLDRPKKIGGELVRDLFIADLLRRPEEAVAGVAGDDMRLLTDLPLQFRDPAFRPALSTRSKTDGKVKGKRNELEYNQTGVPGPLAELPPPADEDKFHTIADFKGKTIAVTEVRAPI